MAGALIVQDGSTVIPADDATTVSYNDTPVTVTCVVASPPAWLDTAGNIIAPGMYRIGVNLAPATPPTTPGLLGYVTLAGFSTAIPIDVLDDFGGVQPTAVFTLTDDQLPTTVQADIQIQTDITGECAATAFVSQLASVAT